jgi:hypothetical protein
MPPRSRFISPIKTKGAKPLPRKKGGFPINYYHFAIVGLPKHKILLLKKNTQIFPEGVWDFGPYH